MTERDKVLVTGSIGADGRTARPVPAPWRLVFGQRNAAKGHIPVLDGVRAASILLVMGGHLVPLGPSELMLNDVAAAMGMSLFFTLSGFLIVRFLWADQRIAPFLIRRFARIVPLATVFAVVMGLILTFEPRATLELVTYVSNYAWNFPPGTGPLWSLCVEMHFYVAIALAVAMFGRRGLWLVPVVMIGVTMLRIAEGTTLDIRTHLRVDEILVGGVLALGVIHFGGANGGGPRWARHLIWPVGLLFAASASPHLGALGYARPYLGGLTVLILMIAPYGWARVLLSSAPAAYIARISYALYILHMGLASYWFAEGDRTTLYFVKRPLTLALTFAGAHLSTNTLEKWGNAWGKRLIARLWPSDGARAAR